MMHGHSRISSTGVALRRHETGSGGGTPRRTARLTFVRAAEAENEARQTEERLRHAQKLEVVGRLTGGIAHDFNNLLAVILGNLELIEDGLAKESTLHTLAQKAIGSALRGADLTNRLLAFSRKQTLESQVTDANRLVLGLTEMLRRALGKGMAVTTDLHDDIWMIKVDRPQLENCLLNLALNARDAMSCGGTLTVRTDNLRLNEDDPLLRGDGEPGRYVMLSLSDTGEGMSRDVARRAFEPFFTTKQAGEGTGLGLSMVYGFARQSGGFVLLDSEEGRGTTISLFFRRVVGAADAPATNADEDFSGAAAHNETLLVVEDDAEVRALATRMLTGFGYRVLQAASGEEALAALDRRDDIDLLLTDLQLPRGVGGAELAAQAQELRADIRVAYMSAFVEGADVRSEDAPNILQKPFRRADMARLIRRTLDGPDA